ncbi:DUF1634 domain-containing protein [Tepidibacillus sp. LV47]|uniref:DUF1634 domain-containing protein n=1 Tax=Tepidibacillus sp. LV47 TaxID=3398228 RepID=UPI003AB0CEA2
MDQANRFEKNENHHAVMMEIVISKSLRYGVTLSVITILLGLILFIVTGKSGYPGHTFPTTLSSILAGLISLKPYAIIMTGLLMLILTPVFRVGVSIIAFFLEKDYLYVVITTIVFIILITSFFLGKVTH